jgi:hypothetical protein
VMSIFRKYVEKIQVSLQSDKTKGYCTWRPICVQSRYVYSHDMCKVTICVKSRYVYSHDMCKVTICVKSRYVYSHNMCKVTICIQSRYV